MTTHAPDIVTYRYAYRSGTVSLCARCAEDPRVLAALPSLGPVEHGSHRGTCQGARPRCDDARGWDDYRRREGYSGCHH